MSKNKILVYNQNEYCFIGVQKRINPFISPQKEGEGTHEIALVKIFVPEEYKISETIIKEHFGDFLKCRSFLGKHADILVYPSNMIWPPRNYKYDPIKQTFI